MARDASQARTDSARLAAVLSDAVPTLLGADLLAMPRVLDATLTAMGRFLGARRLVLELAETAARALPLRTVWGEEVEGPPTRIGPAGARAGNLELWLAAGQSASPELIGQLEVASALLTGIPDRVAREAKLGELSDRFRTFAEQAPVLISELDTAGTYLYASPSFEELLGIPPHEIVGTSPAGLIHPDDLESSRGGLVDALRGGGIAHAVQRLRHRNGTWRHFDNSGRAFRTAEGALRFVSIGVDVSERLQLVSALRDSEAQLLQAQKMDSLGRLAGGVAHDFNNLLMVILGECEALDRLSGATGAAEAIRSAADRAAGLTRQLLAFARPSLESDGVVDLNDQVTSMVALLSRTLGEDVTLVLDLDHREVPVPLDAGQLDQVVMNLAVNARDAMPYGGELRVRTRCVDLEELEAARLGVEAGPAVQLFLEDTGSGMGDGVRSHAFDPFFTTKDPGKGTGLGLAIVYRVVQRAGGGVAIESGPGSGTRIQIVLPRAPAVAQGPAPPDEVPVAEAPPTTVLVVEDEDAVRRVVVRLLSDAGYDVRDTASPEEALRLDTSDVDLLVSDVVMPGMTGIELASRLTERKPGLRVVLISGYPRRGDDLPEQLGYLEKPFTRAQLMARIDLALAGSK
jgi:PAS domain S-box-containing protein